MKAFNVLSAPLFLSALILGVSAEVKKYDFKIEQKNISPDGQEQLLYQAPVPLADQPIA
jgi:hypothetical protein